MQTITSRRRANALVLAAMMTAGLTTMPAIAEEFPSRPIRIVVPFAAGGGTDAMARMLGTKLGERLKTNVIVENKPGAGGALGNDMAAKAAPDGYTVLLSNTAVILQPAMMVKLPYDFMRDMQPLTVVARGGNFLMVPKDVPANTLTEFLALAKADPKNYALGTYGTGTTSHVLAAMLSNQAGLDVSIVHYKGAAPLVNDIMGGQIRGGFVDVTSAQPFLNSPRIKLLAVTGAKPAQIAPHVPTFTQQGFKALEPYGWFALFTQAATPATITKKLSDAMVAVLADPEMQARLRALSLEPGGEPMADTARQMKADAAIWSQAIKAANVRLE